MSDDGSSAADSSAAASSAAKSGGAALLAKSGGAAPLLVKSKKTNDTGEAPGEPVANSGIPGGKMGEEKKEELSQVPGSDAGPPGSSVAEPAAGLDATPQAQISPTDQTGASSLQSRRRKRGEKVDLTTCRIGFIGAGKMAEAIVKGLLQFAKVDPKRIFVSSKSGRTLDSFKQMSTYVTRRAYDIFGRMDCDIVFLVVHGFVIKALYKTGGTRPMALTTNYIPNQRHPVYLLSMIGGVKCSEIKPCLLNPENPDRYRLEIHRIMVNYSVMYGIGIGAIDVEPDSRKCSPIIRDLLTTICRLEYFTENTMDVACAVGGNGLCFCFYFLAALADGGFKLGLPKPQALKIAAKTLQSASASLLESGKHPSDLRDTVTSPSGPAIYGLHVLEKGDSASGISSAVEAAFKRIKELCDPHHSQ